MIRGARTAAAILATATLATAATGMAAPATYEHARATGQRCSTCHDSKQPHLANLNATGRFFLQHRTLDGYTPAADAEQTSRRKPAAPKPGPAVPTGQDIYDRSCAMCHGPGGRGTPLAAGLTGPRQHATTEAAAADVIRNGIKGTAMTPFRTALTEQEIRDVAKYVMTLKGPAPRK